MRQLHSMLLQPSSLALLLLLSSLVVVAVASAREEEVNVVLVPSILTLDLTTTTTSSNPQLPLRRDILQELLSESSSSCTTILQGAFNDEPSNVRFHTVWTTATPTASATGRRSVQLVVDAHVSFAIATTATETTNAAAVPTPEEILEVLNTSPNFSGK